MYNISKLLLPEKVSSKKNLRQDTEFERSLKEKRINIVFKAPQEPMVIIYQSDVAEAQI